MSIKEKISGALAELLGEENGFSVDLPDRKATDADYSTNAGFVLSKKSGENPNASAEAVSRKLKESYPNLFDKIETKGGFINMWVSPLVLKEEILLVLKDEGRYGSSSALEGRNIQVEFISANPTGPLTLANGRGGFYGDVLSNILEFSGAKVEREYYVNDAGNQVLTLGKSILSALGFIEDEEEFYKGSYIKEWALKNSSVVEKRKADPSGVGESAAHDFLSSIKSVVEGKARIRFDRYTSEKNLGEEGLVKKALEVLKKSGLVYDSEGATWLRTTDFKDDKDRVLITSDGLPTYFLSDAGHYLETLERGFDWKINILGPDHYGYVKRIQAVAKILGFRRSEVLITQAILIKKDGEFVRMSKRKGEFVTFEELVDEVGVDTARFFFLMVGRESHIDFDLALAKEKSSRNPVFYAEYAYVRANKIISNYGKSFDLSADLACLNSSPERELMSVISRLPDVVSYSSKTYEIHHLTKYALDLARAFHNFYEKERVIGEKEETARLILVSAFLSVMQNTLRLLGIVPPESM